MSPMRNSPLKSALQIAFGFSALNTGCASRIRLTLFRFLTSPWRFRMSSIVETAGSAFASMAPSKSP